MYSWYQRQRFVNEVWIGIILSAAALFALNPEHSFRILPSGYNNKIKVIVQPAKSEFRQTLTNVPQTIDTFAPPHERGFSINPERTPRFSGGSRRIDLEIIKEIESGGDALAFNPITKCYGLYQISQMCLEDFNKMFGTVYTPQDLFNPQINEEISRWYFTRIEELLLYFEIPVSRSHLIAAYNWGIGNVVRWYREGALIESLPQETRNYIERYQMLAAGF